MWSDKIEQTIYSEFNLTRSDSNFTKVIVDKYTFEVAPVVIGDGYVKAGLQMGTFVQPVCNQPTGAQPEICIPYSSGEL